MNKKFLSAILFGALMVTSTGTFVSCKDYDDDIAAVQEQVDASKSALAALETQLTSLQNAAAAAQTTADATKAAAAAAKAAGDEAKAAAEEAKAAAAQAKIDAIAEATAKIEALKVWVAEQGYATKEELAVAIAAISGQVEGIEGGLSDLTDYVRGLEEQLGVLSTTTLSNIVALQEDLEAQKAAIEKLMNSTTDEALAAQLQDVLVLISELQNNYGQSIGNLEARLNDLDEVLAGKFESQDTFIAQLSQVVATLVDDVDANKSSIEELWAEINGEGANSIRTQIGQLANTIYSIQGEIATLHVLANGIASLTFIPEAFVGGVEAIVYGSYEYKALTLANKDSKDEVAEEGKTFYANPAVLAKYHVSPTTATFDQVKDQLSFALVSDAKFYGSRAMSEDLAVTPEFVSLENGILTVKVNIEGTAATEEFISVVALQIANEEGAVVTSDYATIYKQDLKELAIADMKKFAADEDYHFRRYINEVDSEAGNSNKVWEDYTQESVDLVFDYEKSLDLNEYVGVHAVGGEACSIADLEALGMNLEYDIVLNYLIGDNETDQKDFVNLADGVLTAKVFDEIGAAAIGRTPIVRVRLMDGENLVKVAYVKVLISKDVPEVDNNTFPIVVNDFKFERGEDGVVSTTVEQINKQLYNVLGLSKAEFHALYSRFEDVVETADLGEVIHKTETIEGETTHLLVWTITNQEMWENAGKAVSNTVYFRIAGTETYVAVELKSNLEGLKKEYNITKADFIANYWDANKTYTKFNVAVPSSTTDEEPANCTFVNNLNSPFTTWPANSDPSIEGQGIPGILKLDPAVTGIEYFFCADDVATITEIGGIEVEFTVSADGYTLYANGETIATIDNEDDTWANVITYNKDNNFAKQLLNTGAMYTYIGAKGYACEDEEKPVAITFDGEDHFKANFIRPVNIAEQAADNFIDGVDFGEKGSYIRLEDLIAPYDWRGRFFSEYKNYWGYYGPFSIKVLTAEAECDLNGERQAVPTTVVLEQIPDTEMGDMESKYGFLTYKNNGTNVEEFNVYVKVEVTYGWGVIETGYIQVPVKSTIAAE